MSVARITRDLQSTLGWGAQQVRGPQEWLEKSCGIAVLAYVLVLKLCYQEITPGKPWSVSGLQHSLRLRVMTNQVEHNVKEKPALRRQVASFLRLPR